MPLALVQPHEVLEQSLAHEAQEREPLAQPREALAQPDEPQPQPDEP